MIDFSDCEVDPGFAYDGANGKKICILYEGERYMMKFPPVRDRADGMQTESTFTRTAASPNTWAAES